MTHPTLINLIPNEYNKGLNDYLLGVNLDVYVGSSNALNVLSNKVCLPNKTD